MAARLSPNNLSPVGIALLPRAGGGPTLEGILPGLFPLHLMIMEKIYSIVCVYIEYCTGCITLCSFSPTPKVLDTFPLTNLPHSLQIMDDFPLYGYLIVYFASLLLIDAYYRQYFSEHTGTRPLGFKYTF